MPHTVIKSAKIALWILVPFYIAQGTGPMYSGEQAGELPGDYRLLLRGSQDLLLTGDISYETVLQDQDYEAERPVLKLNLNSSAGEDSHSLGFIIAGLDDESLAERGTFEISRNQSGFLHDFKGVFGFANIATLGEQPFFAEEGRLTIGHMGKEALRGTVEVSMVNAAGKTVDIRGSFIAVHRQ